MSDQVLSVGAAKARARVATQERHDRFVCAALTGLLAAQPTGPGRDEWNSPIEVAQLALEYAEAAIEAAGKAWNKP